MSDTRPILCYSKNISYQPRESLRKKATTAATADEEKKSKSLRLPSPKNSACASPMKFQTSSSAARKPSANSHFHQVQGACNILSTRAFDRKKYSIDSNNPFVQIKKRISSSQKSYKPQPGFRTRYIMDVARTGNFPCARFSFFCIIFRIVFFLYLVNLVITLLGCHLSVPLSSSRQPVGGGDRLRR